MMNHRINRRSRGGFTVIELLVVIGIITLLTAIMGSILGKLRERTKVGQARTLVEKCYSGLEQYHLIFRAYPPATTPSGLTKSQALYYYLSTTFSPTPVAANGEQLSDVYCATCAQFQATEYKPNGAGTDIIDSWNMPLMYRLDSQTDSTGIITYTPVIYSFGPNKVDDNGPDGVQPNDDIVIGK